MENWSQLFLMVDLQEQYKGWRSITVLQNFHTTLKINIFETYHDLLSKKGTTYLLGMGVLEITPRAWKELQLRNFKILVKEDISALIVTDCVIRIDVVLKNWTSGGWKSYIIDSFTISKSIQQIVLSANHCRVLQLPVEFESCTDLLQYDVVCSKSSDLLARGSLQNCKTSTFAWI